MKYICNQLYQHLIDEKYYDQILFLTNEECESLASGYNLEEVEGMIVQPFYANKKWMDKMPSLKWVQVTSAGYDRVDLEEIRRRGIVLTNTRGVMSISIAEDVFAKMLFFARRIREVEENKKKAEWNSFGQDQWMCSCYDDLYHKNIGIMGLGSIGIEIAKRANAFGMHVFSYGRKPVKNDLIEKSFVGEYEINAFYQACDYIVLALPYDEKTHHMIAEDAFEQMKETAIFINIARGMIVDTDALVAALQKNKIKGAALDVFETEPLAKESELWNKVPNLFISSHKAGMGDSWKGFIGSLIMENIEHYNKKETLENIIALN